MHLPSETQVVRAAARQRAPRAERRDLLELGPEVGPESKVKVVLQAAGLRVDEPQQEFTWRGITKSVAFAVSIPRWRFKPTYTFKISIEIEGVPVGYLKFLMSVHRNADGTTATEELPEIKTYRYVFVSYASEDREEVGAHARTLSMLGLPYFFDVDALRAGDNWELKLKEHVQKADLFLLFWSQAASASKWVEQEAVWALERQRSTFSAEPEIKPYLLGEPPPKPPTKLSHLHFERARSKTH